MQLEAKKYLYDMKKACDLLSQFTNGVTFEKYDKDVLLQSAVERQFEILGEALNYLLRVAPELEEQISECGKIIGFRNMLIHGYAKVSNAVVWSILETKFPVVKEEVENLLRDDNEE